MPVQRLSRWCELGRLRFKRRTLVDIVGVWRRPFGRSTLRIFVAPYSRQLRSQEEDHVRKKVGRRQSRKLKPRNRQRRYMYTTLSTKAFRVASGTFECWWTLNCSNRDLLCLSLTWCKGILLIFSVISRRLFSMDLQCTALGMTRLWKRLFSMDLQYCCSRIWQD
jgi:hypothetical protein